MQYIKISGGTSIFTLRNAYGTTNAPLAVQEVDTFTLPTLASAGDGDYAVSYDATGLAWAVALDTTGAQASTPTGATWAAIPAARKVYWDVSGTSTAPQMATAVSGAWKTLPGFTAAIVSAPSTATVVNTSVGYAVNTAPSVHNKDDSGAGSITVARTTTGVAYAALTSIVSSATGLTVAKTPDLVNRLHIFDSSGQALVLAVGAAGAELAQLFIPPGGLPMTVDVIIPKGSRIAIRAIGAAAAVGQLLITGVQ